jgi:predicted glycogen debranching enzyme
MAMTLTDGAGQRLDDLLVREGLAVNHLGSYACSTIPGLNTRKYHGLLVAAMAPPVHRMVLLSRVEEVVRCDGWPTPLACSEYPGAIHPQGHQSLRAFAHQPHPRWDYRGEGWAIDKSLQLLDGQNAVVLTYALAATGTKSIELELRPLLALRSIHDLMYQWNGPLGAEKKSRGHHRVPPTTRTPEVFFAHDGAFQAGAATWYFNTIYRQEQDRGYAGLEDLWSPGLIRWKLSPGQSVHFICSSDPIDLRKTVAAAEAQASAATSPNSSAAPARAEAPAPARARETNHDLLARAASRFLVQLPADAEGNHPVAVISRFPWSAPAVRDALIAFCGLFLMTGRHDAGRTFLMQLLARLKDGLLPTEFSEDGSPPVHDGADTSLWFINAAWDYLRYAPSLSRGAGGFAERLLSAILQIIEQYRHGTGLGICADEDGLLCTHAPGLATTWMNAKIGDWVITPRAGRPVELNALWYNAVRIAQTLCQRAGDHRRSAELDQLATNIQVSFNRRFWNEHAGCCVDVVHDAGPDPSIRPNQLLAMSLPFAVLSPDRHAAVLTRCMFDLLTPFGLRTLSPRDPSYQARYGGDVVSRDRAIHQGSVHPWLFGPLIAAHLRVHGRGPAAREQAVKWLEPCLRYMRDRGMGQLCELFDGDPPHRPGGAIASATAVGELLRCYVEDILDHQPQSGAGATLPELTLSPNLKIGPVPT